MAKGKDNYLEAEDRTKNNNQYEKIHGKAKKVGKGMGERVGKRAKGAMEERKKRMEEELGKY